MNRIAAMAEWEWHYRIERLLVLHIEYQFQVRVKRFDEMAGLAGPPYKSALWRNSWAETFFRQDRIRVRLKRLNQTGVTCMIKHDAMGQL